MKLFILAGAVLSVFCGTAMAEGDAVKGEAAFKKCMACHAVADKTNKTGPHLVGVVGRAMGAVEGYKYSKSLMELAATGAVWDDANLDKYLENPKSLIAQGKMAFPGLKKPEERADLIAFLKTKQ